MKNGLKMVKKESLNQEINNDKIFKAIDLFAGVGGIRLGFENVFKDNFEVVFSSEIDNNAKKTYQLNFDEEIFGDITKIHEEKIPAHDIILAGFPCQAFSIAGHRKGFDDTRGTLFFDVARIAKYHKPKVIFLENVKGFKNHDNGNTFKVVKKTLEEIGYQVFDEVLNSKDFNIPQNRERIYIVAFLEKCDFRFPEPLNYKYLIHEYLDKNVDEKYYYNNKPLFNKIVNDIEDENSVYQWRRKYVRKNQSGVCPTLTANMGTGGHNVPIVKVKDGIRKLTPYECAKFQGFPESFKFPSNLADCHKYKQMGNSVSINVIEALAKSIYKVIK
jgi:DNA (cytosine-5)-methyltransferase 1